MTTTSTLYGQDLIVNKTARTGDEIRELAEFLKRQAEAQRDFVVPPDRFTLGVIEGVSKGLVAFEGVPPVPYDIRPLAHNQLALLTGIPQAYYNRMLGEDAELLAQNANRWMPGVGKNLLVRTYNDLIRAVLSDAYFPLDNIDAFYNSLKVARELGGRPIRVQLGEQRFYVALVNERWEREVYQEVHGGGTFTKIALGKVCPCVTVSDSEVGRGGLTIDIGLFETICKNENVWISSLARVHRGKRMEVGFVSSETRRLEAELVWSTVRDAVRAAFDEKQFEAMVANMNRAANEIVAEPTKAIEVVAKAYNLSEDEQDALLNEFTSPTANVQHGPSRLALAEAFSFLANTKEDGERAQEFRQAAGALIANTDKMLNEDMFVRVRVR